VGVLWGLRLLVSHVALEAARNVVNDTKIFDLT